MFDKDFLQQLINEEKPKTIQNASNNETFSRKQIMQTLHNEPMIILTFCQNIIEKIERITKYFDTTTSNNSNGSTMASTKSKNENSRNKTLLTNFFKILNLVFPIILKFEKWSKFFFGNNSSISKRPLSDVLFKCIIAALIRIKTTETIHNVSDNDLIENIHDLNVEQKLTTAVFDQLFIKQLNIHQKEELSVYLSCLNILLTTHITVQPHRSSNSNDWKVWYFSSRNTHKNLILLILFDVFINEKIENTSIWRSTFFWSLKDGEKVDALKSLIKIIITAALNNYEYPSEKPSKLLCNRNILNLITSAYTSTLIIKAFINTLKYSLHLIRQSNVYREEATLDTYVINLLWLFIQTDNRFRVQFVYDECCYEIIEKLCLVVDAYCNQIDKEFNIQLLILLKAAIFILLKLSSYRDFAIRMNSSIKTEEKSNINCDEIQCRTDFIVRMLKQTFYLIPTKYSFYCIAILQNMSYYTMAITPELVEFLFLALKVVEKSCQKDPKNAKTIYLILNTIYTIISYCTEGKEYGLFYIYKNEELIMKSFDTYKKFEKQENTIEKSRSDKVERNLKNIIHITASVINNYEEDVVDDLHAYYLFSSTILTGLIEVPDQIITYDVNVNTEYWKWIEKNIILNP